MVGKGSTSIRIDRPQPQLGDLWLDIFAGYLPIRGSGNLLGSGFVRTLSGAGCAVGRNQSQSCRTTQWHKPGLDQSTFCGHSIGELADNTTLPILQDTSDQSVASQYGAEKWYVYLIGPDQKLKLLHYSLDLIPNGSDCWKKSRTRPNPLHHDQTKRERPSHDAAQPYH